MVMRVFHCLSAAALLVLATAAPALAQRSETRMVETRFLWTQTEADEQCPRVAAEAGGRWTGQWRMSTPGQTSTCEVTDIVERRPARTRDIDAGPIWNQADAEAKCPRVASDARGRWTGQWRTVSPGRSSVCEVADIAEAPSATGIRFVEAGPIWSQSDAATKCPVAAAAVRGRWSGEWRTMVQGQMSVCGIVDIVPSEPRSIEAGPIWSQADAELKCPVAAFAVRGRWTGKWVTTRQGRMSVCEVAD
jgi:ribosome modulation factor